MDKSSNYDGDCKYSNDPKLNQSFLFILYFYLFYKIKQLSNNNIITII